MTEYIDFAGVANWAYNNFKLTILRMRSPSTHSYLGAGARIVYVPDNTKLFYEIGRYVVATNEQRAKSGYGLFTYNAKQLDFIHRYKRINAHTIQDYRAYTYAYYLHGWFNYKTYGWKKRLGYVDDVFELQKKWPTYNLEAEVNWLHFWGLMKDFVPTGKVFTGVWNLDDPTIILEGMNNES